MFRAMTSLFALAAVVGCQPVPQTAANRNSVIAEAEIDTTADLRSPYGAGLKGTGGGVVTVDGRILKIKTKHFKDGYFYTAVTPSVLKDPIQPLQLSNHFNWPEFLSDLQSVNSSPAGFNSATDIADSLKAIRISHVERAICHTRDLFTPSPLASDFLEKAFIKSARYSPKADALIFVGKCVPTETEA